MLDAGCLISRIQYLASSIKIDIEMDLDGALGGHAITEDHDGNGNDGVGGSEASFS
jgi:hypothetical protein